MASFLTRFLGQVFKAAKQDGPIARGCTYPFTCCALDYLTSNIIKIKPDFIYAYTPYIFFDEPPEIKLQTLYISSLSRIYFLRAMSFSLITTMQLPHSRKLMLMQYYF